MKEKQEFTPREVADLHGVTEVTVRVWRARGMPARVVGGAVRFDRAVVEAWVRDNRVAAPTRAAA